MGRKLIDITGKRIGKLLVIRYLNNFYWECMCDCGNITEVQGGRLRKELTKSCGCLSITHGMYGTPTYRSWQSMLQRCLNENNTNYFKYGGVRITVDDSWNPLKGGSFENFLNDMGIRPNETSLNRIESAKVYSKNTCEWATLNTQSFDQRLNKRSKTGIAGVRFREDRSVYEAYIYIDNKSYLLYHGDSLLDAISARKTAEINHYGKSKIK